MIFVLYTFIVDCAHLARKPLTLEAKFKIFLAYLFNTLFLPLAKLLNVKTINFLGISLKGFDFRTLQFLLGEIFVRNEYYFQTSDIAPIIVDCGAEVGFTVAYFKFLYPKSRIIAFEPDPANFNLLQKNIKTNGFSDITVFNQAVSDRSGHAKFYTSHQPGSLRGSLVKERQSERQVTVEMVRLANSIKSKKIAYLKMDIEGYESVVIADLVRAHVLKNINQIGIEYHHHIAPSDPSRFSRFLSLLEGQGFKYQLSTRTVPYQNSYQDVIVLAYQT